MEAFLVQCVRGRLAVLAQRGEYDSAEKHRMDGVCVSASRRSPVPLSVVRFSVGDFALSSLQSEGGVTKNTVTFNESAACASHAEIAQSPWR